MLSAALAAFRGPRPLAVTALFLTAIGLGSAIGAWAPTVAGELSGAVDNLVLVLVAAIFFTLRIDGMPALRRAPRTVFLAVGANFLIIPVIAWALTSVLVPDDALRLGVLIYCLFPCTDWFLGFTRLAGGDTAVGSALIPLQLILQLALYPVWLGVFASQQVDGALAVAGPALLTWFVVPAGIALSLRWLLGLVARPRLGTRIIDAVDGTVPFVIVALIVCLFAGNVGTILADPSAFGRVLVVVFLFFLLTTALSEVIARTFQLSHSEHALLATTTSARNAPLMLAVTTIALPDHPVVAAAIVIGMLVEFPHLTALTHLLARQRQPGHARGDGQLLARAVPRPAAEVDHRGR